MTIIKGCTRLVLLTSKYAIKIPLLSDWTCFLRGLLCNIQECDWWNWTRHDDRLCPIVFYIPGGFLLVMPRTEKVYAKDIPSKEECSGLPLDYKTENFGRLNDRIVLIDYGS